LKTSTIDLSGFEMPKKLEKQLKVSGKKKGLKGSELDAYVYGTMRETGWKPSKEVARPSRKKRNA
jgi:hypothetical protein